MFHEPVLLDGVAPGQLLCGRFLVLGRVGMGGMSEVFLASENVSGKPARHVAIKAVRSRRLGGMSDAQAAALFSREGRTLLSLGQHPNLCQGYEVAQVGDREIIVMEWIDGISVHALVRALEVRGERPSPGEVAAMMAQVAAGLEHAHRARRIDGTAVGLVHRDVNPTNLMVRYDGVLKVIDFGVARTGGERFPVHETAVVGKCGYMAPEQLRGHRLDARTDVFALGVCMFELLTGARLYRRDSWKEVCQAILNDPVPSALSVDASIPAGLEAVVRRALQKDPAQRFQSAGAFQAALEAHMLEARLPMGARPVAELVDRVISSSARAVRLQPSPTLELLLTADRREPHDGSLPVATVLPPPEPSPAGDEPTALPPASTITEHSTPSHVQPSARRSSSARWVGLALAAVFFGADWTPQTTTSALTPRASRAVPSVRADYTPARSEAEEAAPVQERGDILVPARTPASRPTVDSTQRQATRAAQADAPRRAPADASRAPLAVKVRFVDTARRRPPGLMKRPGF